MTKKIPQDKETLAEVLTLMEVVLAQCKWFLLNREIGHLIRRAG